MIKKNHQEENLLKRSATAVAGAICTSRTLFRLQHLGWEVILPPSDRIVIGCNRHRITGNEQYERFSETEKCSSVRCSLRC